MIDGISYLKESAAGFYKLLAPVY